MPRNLGCRIQNSMHVYSIQNLGVSKCPQFLCQKITNLELFGPKKDFHFQCNNLKNSEINCLFSKMSTLLGEMSAKQECAVSGFSHVCLVQFLSRGSDITVFMMLIRAGHAISVFLLLHAIESDIPVFLLFLECLVSLCFYQISGIPTSSL